MNEPMYGTLIWYYYICHREVWLMARNLEPDPEHEYLDIGRFLQQKAYSRDRKEVSFAHGKIDRLRKEGERLIIGEVKKSSRFKRSAKMQLAYYLLGLKRMGVEAEGELLFPEEKRKERVVLDEVLEAEVLAAEEAIRQIIDRELPPSAEKTRYCPKCAYGEFCWA